MIVGSIGYKKLSLNTMNRFLSPSPVLLEKGIALVRIIVGLLLIYHGIEVFDPELMNGYVEGGMVKGSYAKLMVYLGKTSELTCGCLLFLGLFTRVGALIMIGTFSYIHFFCGRRAVLVPGLRILLCLRFLGLCSFLQGLGLGMSMQLFLTERFK